MSEIVFQVITLGLEHIVVLVFDFPAGPSIPCDGDHGGVADLKVGDEGILVELFAGTSRFTVISHQLTRMAPASAHMAT